jgi:hypothetical protein
MSLETATFIDQLDAANPTTTDNKSQGDDHFRLLKTVLKNSVKRVTRAFYVPNVVGKSANYGVVAADDNLTIVCDTTAAFTLTLPTLASSDAGWCVYVLKISTDTNPVWIAPPSGTINGFTKVRRAVPFSLIKVLWIGSAFFASRSFNVPIGALIPHYGIGLPVGCVWPDGTSFTAADYVELNATIGGNTTPDIRERMLIPQDNGASVSRVTGAVSGIDGNTRGSAGGAESVSLAQTNIPSYTLPNNLGVTLNLGGQFLVRENPNDFKNQVPFNAGSGANNVPNGASGIQDSALSFSVGGGVQSGGSNVPVNKMPPSIVVPHAMVAE